MLVRPSASILPVSTEARAVHADFRAVARGGCVVGAVPATSGAVAAGLKTTVVLTPTCTIESSRRKGAWSGGR